MNLALVVLFALGSSAAGRNFWAVRLGETSQYGCSVTRPANAASTGGCGTTLTDGESCTPACASGYVASVSQVECISGTLSSQYSCIPITCNVTCSLVTGGSCVVSSSAGTVTFDAATGVSQISSTQVRFGGSVACGSGSNTRGTAPGSCTTNGTQLKITCYQIVPAGIDAEEVNDIISSIAAVDSSPENLSAVLNEVGVPNSIPASCMCRDAGELPAACSGESLFDCSSCLVDCTGARQQQSAGNFVVVCNQEDLALRTTCFTQAVCNGLLSTDNQCPIGTNGTLQSCPPCDPAAPAVAPSGETKSSTSSDKKLLLLLLLLLLFPISCILCICILITLALLRRVHKMTAPVPPDLLPEMPPMVCSNPMVVSRLQGPNCYAV
eukprot:TRINITY_DN45219_c0_g1_i1.p1 TRINITY_DN45219_c0_g1~~TRINITY_DN45219_c0_g1_i1.p1  ORF type:complete len:382 (-),score=22.31 TRINITY_DN45219_c0_g1_i1:456-1601(-)